MSIYSKNERHEIYKIASVYLYKAKRANEPCAGLCYYITLAICNFKSKEEKPNFKDKIEAVNQINPVNFPEFFELEPQNRGQWGAYWWNNANWNVRGLAITACVNSTRNK